MPGQKGPELDCVILTQPEGTEEVENEDSSTPKRTKTDACAPFSMSCHEGCQQKALGEYFAVLQVHPNNAFAANGVGAVLAELGQLDDAQVRHP
eukprot:1161515-Pelagomonas_calceolata.AAC.16